MAQQLFTNFGHGRLAAGVAPGDLLLSVEGGQGARFPVLAGGDYFLAVIENSLAAREIVLVTARTVDTFTIVRAQEGTVAGTWVAGDVVALRPTAGYFNRLPGQTALTGSLVTPGGTTAERDVAPAAGYFRYSTTLTHFEGYTSDWYQFAMQSGATGALAIPSGTTAQRSTVLGVGIRRNTETLSFEGYDGTDWTSLGGGAAGGPGNPMFYENDQIMTEDYTIPAGKNAMMTGPLIIAVGKTLEVTTGVNLVVL